MPAECSKKSVNATHCGVLAVGRCAICGDAFCASHQYRRVYRVSGDVETVLFPDQCSACGDQQRKNEIAWNASQVATIEQSYERWSREARQALQERAKMEAYAALLLTCWDHHRGQELKAQVFPELAEGQTPWRLQEVVSWFLSHPKCPPPPRIVVERRMKILGRRSASLPGWMVTSTLKRTFQDQTSLVPIFLHADGRVTSWDGFTKVVDANVSQYGLVELARLLGLGGLPPPPR